MIYDIKQFLKNFLSSRLFVLFLVIFLLFGMIISRLFYLQIIKGEDYQKDFTLLIEKTQTIEASRGNIYDCNGELLAYNQLAYSVEICDNGKYSGSKEKNSLLNAEIVELIELMKKNNETIFNNFSISLNKKNEYEFNVTGSSLKRFLADVFGKESYKDLAYNKTFGFNEANATADDVMKFLTSSESGCFGVDESYSKELTYYIVVIRYSIRSNRYSKYVPSTIAQDVSDATVAYVNEHSNDLIGVSIKEDTIRKYIDSEYFSSIIGYTGKISTTEFDEMSNKYPDKNYTANDTVGKTGLEQKYEEYLRGTNGEEKFYVNIVGKVTEQISKKPATAGNDLYLSIDKNIQKATYKLLEQEISGVLYSKIKTGEIPINDVYFALINNNTLDLEHFGASDASDTEKQVYNSFKNSQSAEIDKVKNNLYNKSVTVGSMNEELSDYFTNIMSMLKEEEILLSSKIDMEDATYIKWKDLKLSPYEYLNYCITQDWIDITKLNIEDKYADTAEIYDALAAYIIDEISSDKDFSKIIYHYMLEDGRITGQQLCLILFDQGVLDYDDNYINYLTSGSMSPYIFILEKINENEITPAQLALDPCTGSCVITDTNTGEIKALVSYPGYDNNKLANGVDADYYQSLREDKSNPLWNYATQERTAPGSTFKMITSTAGLAENVISTQTEIECTGVFKDIENKPKCWVYPNSHEDKNLNVSEALRDSCNVFFYTVGNKLSCKTENTYNADQGISLLTKYASVYGFNETTGVEIAEYEPKIATEYPVMAAIGQSDNSFTTISLSRYVTGVATGKLYDYQLMNKIVDQEGQVITAYEPSYKDISNTLNTEQWNAIHRGMRMVCESLDSFDGFDIEIAGKTGTAQQEKTRPNHALFVGYWPYESPKYSIAVRISYGYSSHNAASAARNIVSYMEGEQSMEAILDMKASGVNTSSSSSITD